MEFSSRGRYPPKRGPCLPLGVRICAAVQGIFFGIGPGGELSPYASQASSVWGRYR
jgi:hypothetical protein